MVRTLTLAIAILQCSIFNLLHAYGYNTQLNFPALIQSRNVRFQEIRSTSLYYKSEAISQIPNATVKTKIKPSNIPALLLQTAQSIYKFTLGLIVSFILNLFKPKPNSRNGTLKENLASAMSLQPEIIDGKDDSLISVTMGPLATATRVPGVNSVVAPKLEEKKAHSWFSRKLSEIRSRGTSSTVLTPTIITTIHPEPSIRTVGTAGTEMKSVKETLAAVSKLVTTAPAISTTTPTISTTAPVISTTSQPFTTAASTINTTPSIISTTTSAPFAAIVGKIIPAVPPPVPAVIATLANSSVPAASIVQDSILNIQKIVTSAFSTLLSSASSISSSSSPVSISSTALKSPLEQAITTINTLSKSTEIFKTFPSVVSEASEDVLYMKYETGPYDVNAVEYTIDANTFKFPPISIEFEGMGELKVDSERIKLAGVSGAVAYALSEAGFWAVSVPLIISTYHANTGAWLSMNEPADRIVIFGLAAGFVSATRVAFLWRLVPALALLPAVDKFITTRIYKTASATTSTAPSFNTAFSDAKSKTK